jgi:acyl-CoA-binding protein
MSSFVAKPEPQIIALKDLFLHYCNIVQGLASSLQESTLLELYGLYKHINTPDVLVEGSDNWIGERPGFFSMAARRKYDAVVEEGKKEGGGEERMLRYVRAVELAGGGISSGYMFQPGDAGIDPGREAVDVIVECDPKVREMSLKMLIEHPLPESGEVKQFSMTVQPSREIIIDDPEGLSETHGDGGGYEEGVEDALLRKRLADFVRDGDVAGVTSFPPVYFVAKKETEGEDDSPTSLLDEACNLSGSTGVSIVTAIITKLKQTPELLEGGFEAYVNSGDIPPIVTAAVAGNVGTVMLLKNEGAHVDMEEMEEFEVAEDIMQALRES